MLQNEPEEFSAQRAVNVHAFLCQAYIIQGNGWVSETKGIVRRVRAEVVTSHLSCR